MKDKELKKLRQLAIKKTWFTCFIKHLHDTNPKLFIQVIKQQLKKFSYNKNRRKSKPVIWYGHNTVSK